MLQIKRTFQFSISDLPLLRFPVSDGIPPLRAMLLNGPLNMLASAATLPSGVEVVQNGSLTPRLPLPGPPVGTHVTISGRIRSTTGAAIPFQQVVETADVFAAYAGSVFVPIYTPDGSLPDAQGAVIYFPDVNVRMEMDATITLYDSDYNPALPSPTNSLEREPAIAFKGIRLEGAYPGLASGYARVSANVVGAVEISALTICIEVSGQSWTGEEDNSVAGGMPWNVVSEVGLERALNALDLSFVTPAVQGGGGGALPIASPSALGGVKVGSGLSIDGTGVLSALGSGSVVLQPYDIYEHQVGDTTEIYGQGATSAADNNVLLVFGERVLLITSTTVEVHAVGDQFAFDGGEVQVGPVGTGVFTIERMS